MDQATSNTQPVNDAVSDELAAVIRGGRMSAFAAFNFLIGFAALMGVTYQLHIGQRSAGTGLMLLFVLMPWGGFAFITRLPKASVAYGFFVILFCLFTAPLTRIPPAASAVILAQALLCVSIWAMFLHRIRVLARPAIEQGGGAE